MIPPKMFLSTGVNDEWFFFGHEGIIQTGKVFYGIFQPCHAKLIVHHAKREIIRNKWLFGKDRIYKRFPVAGKAGKKSPVPFLLRANRAAGSVFERFSAQGAGPVRRIDQYMVRERKQFLPEIGRAHV